MPEKPVFLTAEGKAKLEAELEHLQTVRRQEVAQRIRTAKEGGDVSDNADYDDAKMEQAFVEGRIHDRRGHAQERHHHRHGNHHGGSDDIHLGSRVTVMDSEDFEETYLIVGSAEARPAEGRISNESPLGSRHHGQARRRRGLGGHAIRHHSLSGHQGE